MHVIRQTSARNIKRNAERLVEFRSKGQANLQIIIPLKRVVFFFFFFCDLFGFVCTMSRFVIFYRGDDRAGGIMCLVVVLGFVLLLVSFFCFSLFCIATLRMCWRAGPATTTKNVADFPVYPKIMAPVLQYSVPGDLMSGRFCCTPPLPWKRASMESRSIDSR